MSLLEASLRTELAAIAMHALLAPRDLGFRTNQELAECAVAVADALIAELEKPEEKK